ncbi:hypothetical protein B0H10DRAFT_419488 [Mycena sp. CBHHK59/15]|nr:hypothetical protein B0H10DRAFT_419488 [Mycena sp. CBHHK59/15]
MQPMNPPYDGRALIIPPQPPTHSNTPPHDYGEQQHIPQHQAHVQNPNLYYADPSLNAHTQHSTYESSEGNSAAYGGIEEDPAPTRDRRSAPPSPNFTPPAQAQSYLNGGSHGVQPRRHSADPGFTPPVDPRLVPDAEQFRVQQNLSGIRPHPNQLAREGYSLFSDPRIVQQRIYPAPQTGHGQAGPGEHDHQRRASHQPTHIPPRPLVDLRRQQFERNPYAQQQVTQGSLAEQDPQRRASYQPAYSGATPVDPARQQFERGPYAQQQVTQGSLAEQVPQRQASYQPAHPGAAPIDPVRSQFERNLYPQQQVAAQGRLDDQELRRRASYQPAPLPPGATMSVNPGQQSDQGLHRHQVGQNMTHNSRQPGPQQSFEPSVISSVNTRRGPQPQHIPKHLVMPTPLQQNRQLRPEQSTQFQATSAPPPPGHYSPNPQHVRFEAHQAQPTRAQTIQMVQDNGRQLLRKRSSVVAPSATVVPPKAPTITRTQSYMEPPPTVPETPVPRPAQQEKKRLKKVLSKKRTDV